MDKKVGAKTGKPPVAKAGTVKKKKSVKKKAPAAKPKKDDFRLMSLDEIEAAFERKNQQFKTRSSHAWITYSS